MDDRRILLDEVVKRLLESKHSSVITDKKYLEILTHLKNPDQKVDPHFKHWVKSRQFQIVDITGSGDPDALVIPGKRAKSSDSQANAPDVSPGQGGVSEYLRVVPAGKMFDIIQTVHEKELNHAGYKKCAQFISKRYYGISRVFIQTFCKHCPKCRVVPVQATRQPIQFAPIPVLGDSFLERVHLDIIDMQHMPDGAFNYIGHFVDHSTEFHILFPLKSKAAEEVAEMVEQRVLAYVGPPRMFMSYNGSDFLGDLLHTLYETWGGEVSLVRNQSPYYQSQGLVEGTSLVIEQRIADLKAGMRVKNEGNCPWSSWLPQIMYDLNSQPSETSGQVPYKSLLGREPRQTMLHRAKPVGGGKDLDAMPSAENSYLKYQKTDGMAGSWLLQPEIKQEPSDDDLPLPTPRADELLSEEPKSEVSTRTAKKRPASAPPLPPEPVKFPSCNRT